MPSIEIYDSKLKKHVRVQNPYGKRAKQLYKQLIVKDKKDPAIVLPDGLKYFPQTETFRRIKSQKPKIELRTSYKNYLGELTLRNSENLPQYKGFTLLKDFYGSIQKYLTLHKGVKTQLYAKVLMRKYVDGELLMEDTRWIPSLQKTITDSDGVKSAVGSMSTWVQEAMICQRLPVTG